MYVSRTCAQCLCFRTIKMLKSNQGTHEIQRINKKLTFRRVRSKFQELVHNAFVFEQKKNVKIKSRDSRDSTVFNVSENLHGRLAIRAHICISIPPLKRKYHQCKGRPHFNLFIQVQSLCSLLKRVSTIVDDSVIIMLSFPSRAH